MIQYFRSYQIRINYIRIYQITIHFITIYQIMSHWIRINQIRINSIRIPYVRIILPFMSRKIKQTQFSIRRGINITPALHSVHSTAESKLLPLAACSLAYCCKLSSACCKVEDETCSVIRRSFTYNLSTCRDQTKEPIRQNSNAMHPFPTLFSAHCDFSL
jgi:hypothetical protein